MIIKKIKTLKSLKNRLKKTLPEKIADVINSYDDFSSQAVPEDAKGFNAHHSACKAAVIHAETLLKLAKWTQDEPLEASAPTEDILTLLQEAKTAKESFDDED